MTHDELEAGKDFGRYLDVDGDGIPYRTYPGTHPTRGAYFTRGTTKDRYARYSEAGPDYVDNMQRLLRKFETARSWCRSRCSARPAVSRKRRRASARSSSARPVPAMRKRSTLLARRGIHVNALRVRGFPFRGEFNDFVAAHERVFVIEQNRDAQLKTLLVNELRSRPGAAALVLHYDGTPITARFIVDQISDTHRRGAPWCRSSECMAA